MPEQAAVRMPARQRGATVAIAVAGATIEARAGEMLAATLMAAGIVGLRRSPHAGTPRGAFCLMGVCQECLVRVNDRQRQACLTVVADGMKVELVERVSAAPPQ
jgi:D-hydroxyproline dehydrogenase subunit gamma